MQIATHGILAASASAAAPSFSNTKSIDLDGIDDYVLLASTTQNFTNFSLSFWCIRGGGNYKTIVGANASTEGGILKAIVVAGNKIRYTDSSSGWTALTNNLSSTSWNHVLITYDSSSNTLKGYQDGSLITTINPDFSGQSTNAHSIRYIGARYGTGVFNNLIDEIALWDSVISIGDVWDGGGVPTNLASTNPIHWWRCGDGDTSPTLTDNGSGGINGTMTNFSTFSTNVP